VPEAVDVIAELVAEAEPPAEAELEDEPTATAAVDVELEWLLEPHATTSSAGASANPIRFSIVSR
jgi:hypothetical protein